MNVDETSGTSDSQQELTEEGLASVFEGFLSDEEDQGTPETPPTPAKAPESEPETEEVESSTEPDQSEEGQSEETEETEESETPQPQTFRVKVNGEEIEVTQDELLRGYSRTQDYTRKTQELAKQREAAEQHEQYMRAGREQLATYLVEIERAAKEQESAFTEPDWVKLQQENPAEFAVQWAQWSQYKERMQSLAEERQKAQEAVQRDYATQQEKQLVVAREKLAEFIPEWTDEKKATADKTKMAKAAIEEYGYTEQELRAVIDPRIMRVLRDATLYRELQKRKPQIAEKVEKIKAATPGGSTSSRIPKTKATVAKERLAQSGSEEDLAALFVERGLAG